MNYNPTHKKCIEFFGEEEELRKANEALKQLQELLKYKKIDKRSLVAKMAAVYHANMRLEYMFNLQFRQIGKLIDGRFRHELRLIQSWERNELPN